MKVALGQYVRHSQYGLGVIAETDVDRTSIDFDIHGMKKFVTGMLVIEPAEGVPPKRPRVKRVKKAAALAVAVAGESRK